jgi:hypothetical protein
VLGRGIGYIIAIDSHLVMGGAVVILLMLGLSWTVAVPLLLPTTTNSDKFISPLLFFLAAICSFVDL